MAANYSLDGDDDTPNYFIILTPILYTWTTVVILGLLTDIGRRRYGGLWSTLDPITFELVEVHSQHISELGPVPGGDGQQHHQPPQSDAQRQQQASHNHQKQLTHTDGRSRCGLIGNELAAKPSQQPPYDSVPVGNELPANLSQQPPYQSTMQFVLAEVHNQHISELGPVLGGWISQQQQQQPRQGQPGARPRTM